MTTDPPLRPPFRSSLGRVRGPRPRILDAVVRPGTLWTIAAVSLLAIALWSARLPIVTREAFPIGDGALLEIYTLHASRGLQAVGAYSRFGWHHPGPLFFYLMVPLYALARWHSFALNASALAINLAALTTVAWCLVRYATPALAVTITVALAAYLWRFPLLLISAWNPHIVMLPLAALAIAGSVVASGRLSLLPAVAIAASLMAQTHIGLLPCAALASACALIAGVVHVWRDSQAAAGPRWRWLAASAALAVVLWAPPLFEQVTSADGNLSQIVRFFFSTAGSGIPLAEALSIWTTTMMGVARGSLVFATGQALPHQASAWEIGATIAMVGLLVVAGEWTARRARAARGSANAAPSNANAHRAKANADPQSANAAPSAADADADRSSAHADPQHAHAAPPRAVASRSRDDASADRGGRLLVEAWCCRMNALLAVGAFFSIVGIRGGLADYLVAWVAIVGALGMASLVAVAIDAWLPMPRRLAPAVTIAGLAIAAGAGLVQLERLRDDWRAGVEYQRSPAESLYSVARAVIARTQARRPVLHVSDGWDTGAGVLLALYRRGIPIVVDAGAVWMFGAAIAPDGTEDLDLTVAHRDGRAELRQRRDDCLLIERHGRSLHVLLPSLPKPIPVVCE